jgi:hypothetical protein
VEIIPPARWGHSAVYIPQSDRMLIFGGEGAANYKDTWQFSNVSTIGINQVSYIVPVDFSLEQNYPNPFNPYTRIKFGIRNSGSYTKTDLRIYNIQGREVVVLVNGDLMPGTYEVEFDGSNFPSGVYYYRLTVPGFSETRKMALVK